MLRTLFAISFIALLACGSGETTQGTGDIPPVSAAGTSTDDIEIEKIETIEASALTVGVRSCLGLVEAGAYVEALPVCLEAAAAAPENAEVQVALATAQAEAAAEGSMADAEAQAQSAIDGAIDSAADSASGAAANALGAASD